MTIATSICCDNCPAVLRMTSFSADPWNVVLRADTLQPGWKFGPAADGGHLCPDCDDYDEEAQR